MTLTYSAPLTKYVLYNVGNGWIVLNAAFFSDMHLKLAECDERKKIVDPVVKEITKPNISWYQEKEFIIFGYPIVFLSGTIFGFLMLNHLAL